MPLQHFNMIDLEGSRSPHKKMSVKTQSVPFLRQRLQYGRAPSHFTFLFRHWLHAMAARGLSTNGMRSASFTCLTSEITHRGDDLCRASLSLELLATLRLT